MFTYKDAINTLKNQFRPKDQVAFEYVISGLICKKFGNNKDAMSAFLDSPFPVPLTGVEVSADYPEEVDVL